MKSQYCSVYNNFDLIQRNLQQKIQLLFNPQIIDKPLTYQQILVYLDQQCHKFSSGSFAPLRQNDQSSRIGNDQHNLSKDEFRKLYFRAERNITREIFDSCSKDRQQCTTLKSFIWKYIELLETSKLCLIREEAKQQILQYRIKEARNKVRRKTYVYIKLIQASIHSRYSDSPCFQYKIKPSSIPIITVINSLNPVLNHEYTLEMDQSQFDIVFYESGIEIYTWKFSIKNIQKDGEYFHSIASESVTFEVLIKMLPSDTSEELTELTRQVQASKDKLSLSRKAFQNLCYYMPFQQHSPQYQDSDDHRKGMFWSFTISLFSFLPFMRFHVLLLHYMLIALIFVECLAAVSWAVEFIDLTIAFGLIGALYDQSKLNISMYLWAGLFALFLSTLKTLWGALLMPFGMPKYPLILVIAVIFKILTIFTIWICTIRAEEISNQRIRDLYGIHLTQENTSVQESVPIFKANENYYKNKKNAYVD